MPTVWKGTQPARVGQSERWTAGDHLTTHLREYTRVFEGARADIVALRASSYSVGNSFGDLDGSLVTVESAEITPTGEGDKCQLVVQASNRSDLILPETEWTTSSEDIRMHADYAGLSGDDRQEIEFVLQGVTNPATGVPWTRAELSSATVQELYDKLASGETTYEVDHPVVRETRWLLLYSASGGGGIETPTVPHPSGFDYTRKPDRVTRQGAYWVKTKEWVGTPS